MIRMKYRLLAAVALLGIAGLSSCRQEEPFEPSGMPDDPMTTLTFVSDPMSFHRVTTRASDIKEENEKRINRLHVFFFDAEGNYLEGAYLTGYPDASQRGGYYSPGEGVTLLKIDRELFDNPGLAKSATVYAVANVDAGFFGRDDDGDGRPDGIRSRADLEQFVYRPASGTVSTGLPAEGMPMVGVRTLDLTGGTPENDRQVELTALMARIDVTIQLDSEVQDGNLPAFYLMDWTARNLPTQVAFTAPDAGGRTGWTEAWTTQSNVSLQRTIYNRNGQISFTFYMYENIQQPEWKIDPGEEWANPNVDPATLTDAEREKALYPEGITDAQKQRYKPYLAHADAASIVLHGFYMTYNGAAYEVRYTLYLGANHTNDFSVKRNHQYKNDITIKGLTAQDSETGEYTLDARVNVEEEDNEYYIAMLRERNHDAHFCITPMDVYLFAPETADPTMEVILGEVPEGSETPDPATVPDWVRLERIAAADMAAGTVSESGFTAYAQGGSHLAVGTPWTAGNGKRAFFTRGLLKAGGALYGNTRTTIQDSRDRVYFYLDENLALQDRSATVTMIYKENGVEKRRRTLLLVQAHLLPVAMRDGGTLYMEQYEEYLDHYDPLDEYATDQIYDGLPWADLNSGLEDFEVEQLYETWFATPITSTAYDPPGQVFNDGYPYTSFVIYRSNQGVMTLNDRPRSAFEYCFNRNKRNMDGTIDMQYDYKSWYDAYLEVTNGSKWFLPGIRQMEDALTQYYTTFGEFQTDYYWSSSAGEREGGTSGQSTTRARATKVDLNDPTGYAQSGGGGRDGWQKYAYEYDRGGYALRTEVLRIRAFRIDLNSVD
ncbi:hypothetical protein [uncultured Alistipes sp.]|uniref:DUF4906 domain-containing protein n=1 Tax=uncultured Alistipes sp. TaxID=538949 RepID=UPI00261CB1BF|nr:hypothetical protein [uncultured Alistipes sp.]